MSRRRAKKLPEVLDQEEQARLLGSLKATNSPSQARDLAIVSVMLNAGLRAAELLALTDQDVEWARGRLWVRQGKGGKDRSLWLGSETMACLRTWILQRPPSKPRPSSAQPLFTNLDGSGPICGRRLRYLIKVWAKQAGIEKNLHLHSLRHSFSCNFLRQGGNLFDLMMALGHNDLTTTQIYLHLENDRLEAAMKKLGNLKQQFDSQ